MRTVVTRDTAMASDIARPRRAIDRLTRFGVCLLGVAAIAWGISTLPLFWRAGTPVAAATKILRGDSFSGETLLREAQQIDDLPSVWICNPSVLRSRVVFRLSVFNEVVAARNRALVEATYHPLRDAARQSLSCTPEDAFAWLVLFWIDARQNGLDQENERYLRLSYKFGPNEAWLALWRNRLAFSVFEQLPSDLSQNAIDEFIGLIKTRRLYWQTAAMFKAAPQAAQRQIIAAIGTLSASSRQAFLRTVHDQGTDVTVPDSNMPAARPWR